MEPTPSELEFARGLLDEVRRKTVSGRPASRQASISIDGAAGGVQLPESILELLLDLATRISTGEAMTLVPAPAELSTQQAANALNVSRPHLIKLLNEGRIKFRYVGTHRRVIASSLAAYQESQKQEQHEAAAELTRTGQDLGLV